MGKSMDMVFIITYKHEDMKEIGLKAREKEKVKLFKITK
jgi:hypothetical protein